jgi:hypothetical protein
MTEAGTRWPLAVEARTSPKIAARIKNQKELSSQEMDDIIEIDPPSFYLWTVHLH